MREQNQRLTSGLSAGREALFVLGCRPMDRRFFVSVNPFPGHALHEKGLPRQKGDGPLVSSQEQRALLVLLINRG